ncbi:MAG: LptF/LptG family permease, partial [Pseudohongiella sp.]
RIMVEESARPIVDETSGRRFMLLENGYFYDGTPGAADYSVTEFQEQGILLPEQSTIAPVLRGTELPTRALLGSADPGYIAELQWRISVILLIPVLTLMAVPLSKVDPRQGRFARLVPAALVYGLYFMLLQMSRDAVEDGSLSPLIGMWWVHLVFIAAGLGLMWRDRPKQPALARIT